MPSVETAGVMLHSLESCGDTAVTCVAPLAPSPALLYGRADGFVRLHDGWNGSPLALPVRLTPAAVTALFVDTRGSLVWCGDAVGGVTACGLCPRGGGALPVILFPPVRSAHCAAVTVFVAVDGDALVCSGAADGSVAAWTAAGLVAIVGSHRGPIAALAGVPGGHIVAAGPSAAVLHAWCLPRKSINETVDRSMDRVIALRGHAGGVRSCLSVRSGPGTLWSGGDDGFVRVWDIHDARHWDIAVKDDAEDDDNEDSEDYALRVMAGHRASVVALREAGGVVFSCDAAGVMLAWSAARCWLLHAFAMGGAAPRGDTVWLTGAQCLGRVDGFVWAVDTPNGWHCVCVPSHPHVRKAIRSDAGAQQSTLTLTSAPSHAGGDGLAHAALTYLQEATDLAMQYAHATVEAFLSSMDAQEHSSICSASAPVESSSHLSLGTNGAASPAPFDLPEVHTCAATVAPELSALEERENLLRTIAALRSREAERERKLASIRAELSLMRLKHSDWGTAIGEHVS